MKDLTWNQWIVEMFHRGEKQAKTNASDKKKKTKTIVQLHPFDESKIEVCWPRVAPDAAPFRQNLSNVPELYAKPGEGQSSWAKQALADRAPQNLTDQIGLCRLMMVALYQRVR